MSFQIRHILSCTIAFLPELWIIHRQSAVYISTYFKCNIFISFFSFSFFLSVDMDGNNQKCLKARGLRGLWCIFDGPGDSVHHGWYIFEWHFILAISLILMRFLSFIGVCVCPRQRMWVSAAAAIKWKKSPYQTICFWQWRLTAQKRRDLCWPWTADWTKEAYDTCKIVSVIPPSGRLLK